MDFGREGYCEDDEQMMIHNKSGNNNNNNRQFPFSPSSASASSSSPQYKGFFPLSNGRTTTTTEASIYHGQQQQQQQQQQRGSNSWYETQEESSRSSYDGGGGGSATTPKFELMMEVSPSAPANHHHHHHHHHHHQEDAGESQLALGNNSANTTTNNNNNIQKEHMFDKVVTPSDVGKLNRLVIPKQHAEKYFPLDSSTNEKGLLLNFEDRTGKPWRFRYSYWNSSQSYVMTKGWSRFVKEKKLDAGDIVSFQRGVGELGKDRLYIDWRRRPNAPDHTTSSFPTGLSFPHNFAFHRSIPWSPLFLRPPPANMSSASATTMMHHYPQYQQQQQQQQQPNNINFHHQTPQSRNNNNNNNNSYHYNNAMNPCQGSIIYLRSAAAGGAGTPQDHEVRMVQVHQDGGGGGGVDPMVFDSVPVVHGKAAAKKLRLFGVNMECGVSSSESSSFDESSNAAAAAAAAASQSSSHNIPFTLQSRLYNGIPLQTDFLNKGKSSSMSLDLDIGN